jgi:hypothetical protein
MESNSVIVTPHLLYGEAAPEKAGPFIFRILNSGIFNLGFIGIRQSGDADRFLEWWMDRLETYCYTDLNRGLYLDQKWVDFALCLVDVHVLRHHGYNVTRWNAPGRIIEGDEGQFRVGEEPLRFIHFSGFRDRAGSAYYLRGIRAPNRFGFLLSKYQDLLADASDMRAQSGDWSFSRFATGELIADQVRTIYRDFDDVRKCIPNPYTSSNLEIRAAFEMLQYELVARTSKQRTLQE